MNLAEKSLDADIFGDCVVEITEMGEKNGG